MKEYLGMGNIPPHNYDMQRLFKFLHKSDPTKYPKTIDMKIDDLKKSNIEIVGVLQHDQGNYAENVTKYIRKNNIILEDGAFVTKERHLQHLYESNDAKIISLKEQRSTMVQWKTTTTDGYTDDWAGQIGKKIDDGEIDSIEGIDDILFDIKKQEYLQNPYYEWRVGPDENQFRIMGNDDIGYSIYSPDDMWGEPLTTKDSINEANVFMRDFAEGQGWEVNVRKSTEAKITNPNWRQPGSDSSTYREIVVTGKSLDGGLFKLGHFDEYNAVAHIRVTDRIDSDGKKVFFIEEIQSDWHQKRRLRGGNKAENEIAIRKNSAKIERLRRERTKAQKDIDKSYEDALQENTYGTFDLEEIKQIKKSRTEIFDKLKETKADLDRQLKNAERDALEIADGPITAEPPMKGDRWQEMALQDAIKIASKEGYDRVAWTTAKQQEGIWGAGPRELFKNVYDRKMPKLAKQFANKYGSTTGTTKINFSVMKPIKRFEGVTTAEQQATKNARIEAYSKEVGYIDLTPKGFKKNIERTPLPAAFALPIGGGLIGDKQTQSDDGEGLLKIKKKVTKPKNSLLD
jgi:hypothetical protein